MIIEVIDKINGSKFDLSNIPFVNDIETAKAFLMDTSPFFNSEEDFDIEDPTADMEWDDEGYDEKQMEFTDEKFETMDDMVTMCHRTIDSGKSEIIYNNK